ncbi:hypothetical protein NLU13_9216 [Sarocladium strictum]|uniref:Uncharacterized protein n=1 Tax=Sarocladium strictum TaxID=5046 RepID=A0AA39G9Q1_SARSR|nr:hypothetical protein NLU13_9216 [Sarocladium strictum]
MATAETVQLDAPHAPKEDAIKAFDSILPDLKKDLVHMRKERQKHEPEYFAAVDSLSDDQLADFSTKDITAVRVGKSAYGIHLFAKLQLPALSGGYIHFRVFVAGGEEPPKLHSIHTEERDDGNGGKSYRAVFTESDELEWFDT